MGLWSSIKGAAESAWEGAKGAAGIVTNAIKNLFSKLALLWEVPFLYLFGWMPKKKLRLRVIILNSERGEPVADRARVEAAVAIAKDVFKRELNVRVQGFNGPIVRGSPERAPKFALEPTCSSTLGDLWRTQIEPILSEEGQWFRRRVARSASGALLGYAVPVTIFVVRDVKGDGDKVGCGHLAWFENYGYVEPAALPPKWTPSGDVDDTKPYEDVEYTTLPHEIGHCCDLLVHRKPKMNLMHGNRAARTGTRLTKWQKSVARTSTHVTYL